MHDWLAQLKPLLAHGDVVVLVTVAHTDGSAPRDAGARMLVTRHRTLGTVGGGHLEWQAIESARRLFNQAALSNSPLRRLERVALGPSLGQCCGGAVVLAYERLTLADLAWVAALQKRDEAGKTSLREVLFPPLQAPDHTRSAAPGAPPLPPVHWHPVETHDDMLDHGEATQPSASVSMPQASCDLIAPHHARHHDDRAAAGDHSHADGLVLREILVADRFHVLLFGAGHVGTALVKILLNLRCTIHWVDTRDIPFPPLAAPNLIQEHNDAPQQAVEHAPPGTYFLVMTHSHALDQELSAHILRRADFAFFGLIGSLSKRRQFEHRLLARGIDAGQVARMVCPIGIAEIHDKAPDAIAIAVAAQLLQYVERRRGGLEPAPAIVAFAARPVSAGDISPR